MRINEGDKTNYWHKDKGKIVLFSKTIYTALTNYEML